MTIPAIPDLGRRPLIMGIMNITPDSFSGDGLLAKESASILKQAEQMIKDGADILDIGGESSRPGSTTISASEEIARTAPAIKAIRQQFPNIPLSIDTVKPEVAKVALDNGAAIINDISGANQNPAMLQTAASSRAYLVLMHNSSKPSAVDQDPRLGSMYEAPAINDIVLEVKQQIGSLAETALQAGIKRERIMIDPGLGFGKTIEQNLRLIKELHQLTALGYPVMAGPSRKSFIGRTLDLPVDDRLEGTAAAIAACVLQGASILRVHDVKAMYRVAKMTAAILKA